MLTCRTGLQWTFGKEVGLLSQRMRSLRERHSLCNRALPLASFSCSSSTSHRRLWWSRYADLKDRYRANHLRKEEKKRFYYQLLSRIRLPQETMNVLNPIRKYHLNPLGDASKCGKNKILIDIFCSYQSWILPDENELD